MQISDFQQAAGVSADLASRWFPHIDAAMKEFGIMSAPDQAMFIAQVGHESGGLKQVVESLNYTPQALLSTFGKRVTSQQANELGRTSAHPANQQAIANLVYGGRMGNKYAGDGWEYRGRGLIQITGLDNYRACSAGLKLDLVAKPELLESDQHAARSAAWFFASNGCLKYSGDIEKVTRIINGGTNGLDDRKARYSKALSVLS
ncbi:glycoside hydrolase family 19 protein [Hafnia alvei]|uniref:glycoside hydrolase family 19 protein n=1 Tax=Hafnia alvei TaxID=569 RepID=UPI00396CC1F6